MRDGNLDNHDRYALEVFIRRHGPRWYTELRELWNTGRDSGWQRRIRNSIGPSGLVKPMSKQCECCDSDCLIHPGKECCQRSNLSTLYRVDMEDKTGTKFCPKCWDDAMESGLFSTTKPIR